MSRYKFYVLSTTWWIISHRNGFHTTGIENNLILLGKVLVKVLGKVLVKVLGKVLVKVLVKVLSEVLSEKLYMGVGS